MINLNSLLLLCDLIVIPQIIVCPYFQCSFNLFVSYPCLNFFFFISGSFDRPFFRCRFPRDFAYGFTFSVVFFILCSALLTLLLNKGPFSDITLLPFSDFCLALLSRTLLSSSDALQVHFDRLYFLCCLSSSLTFFALELFVSTYLLYCITSALCLAILFVDIDRFFSSTLLPLLFLQGHFIGSYFLSCLSQIRPVTFASSAAFQSHFVWFYFLCSLSRTLHFT